MSTKVASGCKGGRCLGLTVLPLSCADHVEILGALMEACNGGRYFHNIFTDLF